MRVRARVRGRARVRTRARGRARARVKWDEIYLAWRRRGKIVRRVLQIFMDVFLACLGTAD